jgi:hypothetical protein
MVDHLGISMTILDVVLDVPTARPRWMWIDEDPRQVDH